MIDNGSGSNNETRNWVFLGMETWVVQIGTIKESFTNKTQDVEERLSGIEAMEGEMGTSVTENVKTKKVPDTKPMGNLGHHERPNLRITEIEEREKKSHL